MDSWNPLHLDREMKRIPIIIAIPAMLLSSPAPALKAQPFADEPVAYNNFITSSLTKIVRANVDFILFSTHADQAEEVEKRRLQVIALIESEIPVIRESPPFRAQTRLRDETVNVLLKYLDVYETDLATASKLSRKSKHSVEGMEEYLSAQANAEERLKAATKLFSDVQKKFAFDYRLYLAEGEGDLYESVEKISKANEYSRKIFLVFFRVSKPNDLFMEALNAGDAAAMEKHRLDLSNACKLAVYQLRETGGFGDDMEYNSSVRKLVDFTAKIADEKFPLLVDITKRRAALSKADVDNYNAVINLYNDEYLPEINAFNDAGNAFMKRNL